MKHILIICLAMMLCACAKSEQVKTVDPPAPTATPQPMMLKVDEVMAAFKAAKLPIGKELSYNEETDENHLLGRPHQYTGKINFDDSRIKSLLSLNNTIEVFANEEDMEARRKYVETVQKTASPLAQYHLPHKNVLVRLDHKLTPTQSKEYEAVLNGL